MEHITEILSFFPDFKEIFQESVKVFLEKFDKHHWDNFNSLNETVTHNGFKHIKENLKIFTDLDMIQRKATFNSLEHIRIYFDMSHNPSVRVIGDISNNAVLEKKNDMIFIFNKCAEVRSSFLAVLYDVKEAYLTQGHRDLYEIKMYEDRILSIKGRFAMDVVKLQDNSDSGRVGAILSMSCYDQYLKAFDPVSNIPPIK